MNENVENSNGNLHPSDGNKLEENTNGELDSRSLYRLKNMNLVTKLRPGARTFVREASKLFEVYIYTMGERLYAYQMASMLGKSHLVSKAWLLAQ